ncbi:MAG: FAD-binding protein [Gemmatimonadota bacterium]|jgi:succinate dehydrogenase/fumarate reductase flavoprotein subunit
MTEDVVEADVLCVGGGIAGLMAAIRAGELGAKVVVAEKGNARYSGCGRSGNDHFEAYIPEVHGSEVDEFIDELLKTAKGEIHLGRDILRAQFARTLSVVQLWDEWGIPMRYQGGWEFSGHSFPGRTMTHIKYEGRFQKDVLVREARRRGVQILDRVMVLDLLRQGDRVVGAVCVHTREDRTVVFQAKSVILATGKCSRLYPSLTPGWTFNDPHGGVQSGDGRAMAYRAGAELQNVEMPQRHIGPKYFAKFGQASWIGVLKDAQGRPAGTFAEKPDRKYGDMILEVNKLVAEEYQRAGRGPLYMDCTDMSQEDYEYMMHWMEHEGNVSLLDHMKDEEIDPRRHPIEFATYPLRAGGLVVANEKAETTLDGLYAAGDESFGDISAAATFGWIAGENAASAALTVQHPGLQAQSEKIGEVHSSIEALRRRSHGPDWKETHVALQQVMNDYAGTVRNEALLEQGLAHLRRIKDKARHELMARNSHELWRCLEVLNLMELGELVFVLALDRKETRGLHRRPDYPFTNPTLDQAHVVRRVEGTPHVGWRGYQGGR